MVHMQYEGTNGRTSKDITHGRQRSAKLRLLVTQGTLFWAPAKTWPEWIAVSPTSKTGWWVKATGVRKEGKQLTLEIRSVQRDEFHRLGDIRVDGPATIKARQAWRLRQVLQATTPAWAVLAEEELPTLRCTADISGHRDEGRGGKERGGEGAPNTETSGSDGSSATGNFFRGGLGGGAAASGQREREGGTEGSTVQEGAGTPVGHW